VRKQNQQDELLKKNLATEFKTIKAMTKIYCQAHHGTFGNVCESCDSLIKHAHQKLDRCVYGDKKPACKACPIHCYRPEEKAKTQRIMRYAGPRMLFKHPILAIKHLIKAKKQFPDKIPHGLSNYHQRKKSK